MAAADTANLVASLTLDAKGFTQGASKVQTSLGKLEGSLGNIGRKAGQGIASFTKNVGLIGVAATGALALAVKGGLQDLATLENAITSVDGAIEQMGQTGEITGKQIAGWANDIERNIGAAFDDKDITQAAASLIRFGKVVPANLKQALEVTTDLAVRTGDVESASALLAKALADPAKAAGKLSKAGIILTKAQQDTIKEMVKQNDIAGAQKVILDELAKTTEGAAAASQGKYQRALSVLNDVAEDSRKALAEGFLPVIEKIADKLSTALADPKFINGLREFGTELAGGLDDLVSVAEKLPWATIGESLKIAGAGAKAVLQAFTSLPPWVQTAVITGWGLNKLTGGMLGSITKDLASGLIKGVLGMNAGVVNINAGVVNGVGGVPGAGGAAGGGRLAGLKNVASTALKLVLPVGIGIEIGREIARALGASVSDNPITDVEKLLTTFIVNDKTNDEKVHGTLKGGLAEQQKQQRTASEILRSNERAESRAAQDAAKVAAQIAAGDTRTELAIAGARAATTAGLSSVKSATDGVKASVNAKDLSVSVANTIVNAVTVSVRETIKTTTTHKQYARYLS